MAIHHATLKKAERLGFTVEEKDGMFRAFWPQRSTEVYGVSATEAVAQMEAMQSIKNEHEGVGSRIDENNRRLVHFVRRDDGHVVKGSPMTPHEAAALFAAGEVEWVDETPFTAIPSAVEREQLDQLQGKEQSDAGVPADTADTGDRAEVARSEHGIALDGGVAYREGTPAGDNPYTTETDDEEEYALAVAWDEAWDAAADEAAEEEEGKGGSVVSDKYRAKYAELGHPTHCGDWLAQLLNNLCLAAKSTDLIRFEAICAANGVDLSKYNRTTAGWQGRLRMTGRNLLAKRVYLNGGVIYTPVDGADAEYRAPADWMEAQRYKMPKADQAKPIPTAPEAPAEAE